MNKPKTKLTYEAAILELQQIVTALQEENIGMDEISEKIKRASELIKFCREKLRAIAEEVNEGMRDEG